MTDEKVRDDSKKLNDLMARLRESDTITVGPTVIESQIVRKAINELKLKILTAGELSLAEKIFLQSVIRNS